MGLCPSRNSAASKAAPSSTKACGNLSKVPAAAPTPLPTKSWRALLEDAPLNANAESFQPQTKVGRDIGRPTQENKPLATARNRDQFSNALGPGFAGTDPIVAGSAAATFVDTSAYMQLLKEGDSKKKHTSRLGLKARGTKVAAPGAMRRDVLAAPGLAAPMTAEGLKLRWASAQKPMPGQKGLKDVDKKFDEEIIQLKIMQDDILTEKMNMDRDLSDPAYCSESESFSKEPLQILLCDTVPGMVPGQVRVARSVQNNASSHRLGRRPKRSDVRSYVMQDLNFDLDEAVAILLLRLQRFNEQHQAFKPDTTGQRRFCIGLKEVGRRVKQSKVSCLIVAPDLEGDASEGGLDDRVREILGVAYAKNIPVIFALSRARIGQAMGKHVPISVLGVLDGTGAQGLLKTCVELGHAGREAWLARLSKKK